jgi:tRNA A-37 threonylcarbamoyl transferase component Bud32
MHQIGVTHMDLKPKNVVMSKEWNAVLIDVSGIGGATDEWLLPELFETLDRCSVSWELRVQSDTWALGKILASMAKAIDDGKDEEKITLLQIAQEVERFRGRISLSTITRRLSQVIGSISSLVDNE